MHLSPRIALLGLMVVSLASACSSSPEETDSRPAVKQKRARYKNLDKAGGNVQAIDLNQDSKPDQWRVVVGGVLMREERDLNFNGRPDMYSYFSPKGELLEEEMDLDEDGNIDVVSYYRSGALVRKELSMDFRTTVSVVKHYAVNGSLDRIERDSNEDGKIDTWEYFQDDAKIRIGRDLDSDGMPDVFEELEGSP